MARAANSTYYLGSEFFVYINDASYGAGDAPVGYATECTLSMSANQIDTSNKTSGIWASAMPGQISWSVSTSALYTTAGNYASIFGLFKDRKKVKVVFATCQGGYDSSNNYITTIENGSAGSIKMEGDAYITSLELNAGNSEVASFSIEFTGEGILAKV